MRTALILAAVLAILSRSSLAAPAEKLPKKVLRYASVLGVEVRKISLSRRAGAVATYDGRCLADGLLRRSHYPPVSDGERLVVALLPTGRILVTPPRLVGGTSPWGYWTVEAGGWWPFMADDLGLSADTHLSPIGPGNRLTRGSTITTGSIRDPKPLIAAGITGAAIGQRVEFDRPPAGEKNWRLRIHEIEAKVSPSKPPMSRAMDVAYLIQACSRCGLELPGTDDRRRRELASSWSATGRDLLRFIVRDITMLRGTAGLGDLRCAKKGDLLHVHIELVAKRKWRVRTIQLLRPIPRHPAGIRVRFEADGRVRALAPAKQD
jgi:hypothetical protein